MNVSRAASLSAVRGAWGIVLVAAPGPVVRAVNGRPASHSVTAVIRVLGGREIVQAVLTALRPERRVLLAGAAVDVTHGSSMVLLAAREPKLRRLAASSAAVSATFAALVVGQAGCRGH